MKTQNKLLKVSRIEFIKLSLSINFGYYKKEIINRMAKNESVIY